MLTDDAATNLLTADGQVALGQLATAQDVTASSVGELEDGKGEEYGPCVLRWGQAAWRC